MDMNIQKLRNNFIMDMNIQKLRNNSCAKPDCTISQPIAQVECWIVAIEEQKVTLKTVQL